MSRLGDLENVMVARLVAAHSAGSPVFATVRGISGGWRPAIRDALRRERTPAAFVAFTDEPTAPETKSGLRGARFVVLVAAKALRVETDPRHGDAASRGAFSLLDAARAQLDDYEPGDGTMAVNLHQKFIEADERTAIYELLYRFWPIEAVALTFGGQTLAESAMTMSLTMGLPAISAAPGPEVAAVATATGLPGSCDLPEARVPNQSIIWRGRLRAADSSAMDAIEADIRARILSDAKGDFADGAGRLFKACVLEKFVLDGSRKTSIGSGFVTQDVELRFAQGARTDASEATQA